MPEALGPLRQRGVRVLTGGFVFRYGEWDGSYHLDDARAEYASRSDGLMDFDSGIVFSKADIICNKAPVKTIVPLLDSLAADPRQAEVMDCFTHEQYLKHIKPENYPELVHGHAKFDPGKYTEKRKN